MTVILLRYFWFTAVPLGLLAAVMFHRRARAQAAAQKFSEDDVKRVTWGLGLIIAVPCLLLGFLQIAGGHQNHLFIFTRDYRVPTVLAGWIVLGALWILGLWWVWVGKGAKTIVTFSAAFAGGPASEMKVKLFVSLCVLAALGSLVFGSMQEISNKMEEIIQQLPGGDSLTAAPQE